MKYFSLIIAAVSSVATSSNALNKVGSVPWYFKQPGPVVGVSSDTHVGQVDLARIKLGDFNGDGYSDVYRVEGWGNDLPGRIWLTHGDGYYSLMAGPTMGVSSDYKVAAVDVNRVRLGDFNGDGLTDIYRIEGWGNDWPGRIWLSHGDGNFTLINGPTVGVSSDVNIASVDVARIKLGDFNGDGMTDIYRVEGWGNDWQGRIWLSHGDGHYTLIAGPTIGVSSDARVAAVDVNRVRLGDFNGDGLTDIYRIEGWGNDWPGRIWLSHGDGTYTFITGPVVGVSSDINIAPVDVARIQLGDFNADALTDIYRVEGWGNDWPGRIWLSRGDGNYTFVVGPTVGVSSDYRVAAVDVNRIKLADFDSDGQVDIYRVEGWGNDWAGRIWLNHGNGNFTLINGPTVGVSSDASVALMDVARINIGDFTEGNPDIYRVNGWGTDEAGTIFLNPLDLIGVRDNTDG